jgi:hypothetical protein
MSELDQAEPQAAAAPPTPTMDETTQNVIAVALFVYNSWLNKNFELDQTFAFEEDPLRNFLHTLTPGDPATFQPFFADLQSHYSTLNAMMKNEAEQGWVCDMTFADKSEIAQVAQVAQPSSNKRRVREEETQRE